MNAVLFILLLLVLLGIIIGIPLFLSIIFDWLKKKGHNKLGYIITFSIISAIVFLFYTAFYPLDSFYKEDFENYTKLKFPLSGKIISKDASYPDIHGKYCSDAVVKLSESDYRLLCEKVTKDSLFKTDTIIGDWSVYFDKVTKGIKYKSIIKIVQKGKMKIAFVNDNKTIILERPMQ